MLDVLAMESVSGTLEERLRFQLSLVPIIDLRAANSFVESARKVLDRIAAARNMDVAAFNSRVMSSKSFNRLFSALQKAGIINSVDPTPENMDTTKDSEAMQLALEKGMLKPLFHGGTIGG